MRPKSQSRSVFSGARRVRGPAPGGRAWVRSREVIRDAVCARVVLRVMRWVGKLREQAERVSQDGAWRGRHRPQIARVGVLLPIPRGALGRLEPGGPKLPHTRGRTRAARGPCPQVSRGQIKKTPRPQRRTPTTGPGWVLAPQGRQTRVGRGAFRERDDKHKEELLTKAASTPPHAKPQ